MSQQMVLDEVFMHFFYEMQENFKFRITQCKIHLAPEDHADHAGAVVFPIAVAPYPVRLAHYRVSEVPRSLHKLEEVN